MCAQQFPFTRTNTRTNTRERQQKMARVHLARVTLHAACAAMQGVAVQCQRGHSVASRAQKTPPQRASRPPTMLDGRKELISCVAFDDHLLNSKLLARDQKRVNQAFSRECYEVYIGAKAYLPYATHVGTVSHTPRQIVHMDFANNTSTRLLLSKPLV